jgi:hypothetical protein
VRRSAAFVAVLLAASSAVHAQAWTADLYAGGTRYQALSDRVSTTNLIANIRYEGVRSLLAYLSVAAPLDGDAALWSAAGVGARLTRFALRPVSYGIELGADGYAFREPVTQDVGGGGSFSGLPFVTLSHGAAALELRGGWQQHVFGYADTSGGRGLLEAGARATVGSPSYAVQLDARWLRATEATYPFVGVQLSAAPAFTRVWGWAGRWFGDDRPGTVWGIGGSVPVGPLGELWVMVRREATDPLYENLPRHSWNVGLSRQFGRRPSAPAAELAPKLARGAVQIRLPISALPDANAAPSVAGEFNDWQPAPMRRENGVWVLDLPLGPGAYRFSFVTPDGQWFVPEQYPGRMDDGMGGYVAVMVVS